MTHVLLRTCSLFVLPRVAVCSRDAGSLAVPAGPDSPRIDDLAPMCVEQQFKDVACYRDDVVHRTAEHCVPGRREAAR